jgi:hypothetical protein
MKRLLAAAGALVVLVAVSPALPAAARSHGHRHTAPAAEASRPGQQQYVLIQDHDPRRLQRAARTARDLVVAGQVRRFRIILSGPAVLLAIPGSNTVQKEIVGIMRRHPAIRLVVCREVVDALAKAAHRRPPLLPGTEALTCDGLGGRMEMAGWESVPGL